MASRQLPPSHFHFLDFDNRIDDEAIIAVLRGQAPGCIFRGVIPVSQCDLIAANFSTVSRAREREDGVPGDTLGAYHYLKPTEQYLAEAAVAKKDLELLFAGASNPVRSFKKRIADCLGEMNVEFRNACFNGSPAGDCVARCWADEGPYGLRPHEDMAQLNTEEQRGFEIQQVFAHNIVGVNLCLRNESRGGSLMSWNVLPDDEDRRRLGVEGCGYPYPEDYLEGVDNLTIDIRQGDIYMVNGALVHAVTSNRARGVRLTLAFLMGFISDSTAVAWT